jgi:hypothetical protein
MRRAPTTLRRPTSRARSVGAQRRARGGQIHEVEAGNGEDQHGNGRKAVNRGPAPGRFHATLVVGCQMHRGKGHEVGPHQLIGAHMQRRNRLGIDMPRKDVARLSLHQRRSGAGNKFDIGIALEIKPVFPRRLVELVGLRSVGNKDVAGEMGVTRQIAHHAGDRQRMRRVHRDCPAERVRRAEIFARG